MWRDGSFCRSIRKTLDKLVIGSYPASRNSNNLYFSFCDCVTKQNKEMCQFVRTKFTRKFNNNYRPQRSCDKVMFLHLCVILFTGVSVPACTTGHMTRGVSVQEESLLEGVSLSGGWVSVQGVSVQWESLSRRVSVQRGSLCGVSVLGSLSEGSLSRGGSLCPGGSLLRRPPGQRPHPLYGNNRAVRILLECIVVLI